MLRTLSRFVLALALAVLATTQARAMSSPAVVYQSTNDRIVVFQTGWDHLYDWYWDGTQWIQAEDLGAPTGTTLSSAPAAAYQASVDRLVAFVIADNGRLYARYWAGTQWIWQDLGNPGVRFTGSPSAVYLQSVNRVMVFAIGVDGHLYDRQWNIVTGEWEDRSTLGAGAILAVGSPSISSSIGSAIPGGHRLLATCAHGTFACWHLETIGPLQCGHFGTTTFRAIDLPPFHLACFRAYASNMLLPACLQGSIPGLWLAVTRAGLTPARVRDIAMPQPRSDPSEAVRSDPSEAVCDPSEAVCDPSEAV
jgi:hypothetical protein